MSFMDQAIPVLSDTLVPPIVHGTADLTHFAYQGNDYDALMDRVADAAWNNAPEASEAARTYDAAVASQLVFRRGEGLNLQDAALEASQIFRVGGAADGALRLLALVGPGDLMTNTPLDFLTNYLNVRLDLLYILPDRPLPSMIPDHDIAFFALGEADPATLKRLRQLYATWPRPTLNDPRFLPALERDALSGLLAGVPGICSPTAVAVPRSALEAHLTTRARSSEVDLTSDVNRPLKQRHLERDRFNLNLSRSSSRIDRFDTPPRARSSEVDLTSDVNRPLKQRELERDGFNLNLSRSTPYPCLIRPASSHAGTGLSLLRNPIELQTYLRFSFERHFFVTAFEDYRSADGLYRKSRVAFIDRQPFLCHLAISSNWMVHYLNAGMTESAAKRDEEAAAMAAFDDGFAHRHAAAFDALHERLGFDFYSIDCAETDDGRLLVFEADAAAIVHMMDPVDIFPYKQPQMRKVFAAFDAMLRRRATPKIV